MDYCFNCREYIGGLCCCTIPKWFCRALEEKGVNASEILKHRERYHKNDDAIDCEGYWEKSGDEKIKKAADELYIFLVKTDVDAKFFDKKGIKASEDLTDIIEEIHDIIM